MRLFQFLLAGWMVVGLGVLPAAYAEKVEFSASVDRQEISLEESVSLRLKVDVEGSAATTDASYQAPDFDLINQFESSQVQSFYENGSFGIRNSRSVTYVLRPQKMGKLTISGLSVLVDGKRHTAPAITVNVVAGGAGTPPPLGYGGAGVGLRGAGKRPPTSGQQILLRAEVDRDQVVKGEQLIVSYYLYRRVQVMNVQVDQYPQLKGFLREDLEMPVLSPQLASERVVIDGAQYDRSLLVRYSAFPLKSGKLTIDSMRLRATYLGGRTPGFGGPGGLGNLGDEDDDVFRPFANFFQQMTPMTASVTSDPLSIEVAPLPEEGKPTRFSGAVGQFEIQASVDQPQARVGEPVTLTVRVEGRGNLSSVEKPTVSLPPELELYESKDWVKSGKSGAGERTFQFLLIPRMEGRSSIPPVEFSYYDPDQKKYVTRATSAIELDVAPGVGGGDGARKVGDGVSSVPTPGSSFQPVLEPESFGGGGSRAGLVGLWKNAVVGLKGLAAAALLALAAWLVWESRRGRSSPGRGRSSSQRPPIAWAELDAAARQIRGDGPFSQVQKAYERLSQVLYGALDQALAAQYEPGDGSPEMAAPQTRGMSLAELADLATSRLGLTQEQWKKLKDFLEYSDAIQFAGASGLIQESEARERLAEWVNEARELEKALFPE